jgi:hypothetical protein
MVKPLSQIIYAFAIPSFAPNEVTPFQGFAPGLLRTAPIMPHLPTWPSDLVEPTLDLDARLARRRAGMGDWLWSPITMDNLIRRRPTALQPLMIIFSGERGVARQVAAWRRDLRIRPLHVSLINEFGTIGPHELTLDRMRNFCRTALIQAQAVFRRLDIADALALLDEWQELPKRPTSLRLHSHGTTRPNEMVLFGAGEEFPTDPDGVLQLSPEQDYIDAISESAAAVIALQARVDEDRPLYSISPRRPDIILFAPSMYHGVENIFLGRGLSEPAERAIRSMARQRGYTSQINMQNDAEIDQIGPVASLRGAELKMQSDVVGMRAAATLAATLRLPAQVNRTTGVVAHLARYLRHHDGLPPARKTARVFKAVQDALREAMPPEHMAILENVAMGVKIIGDAPLEWLPVHGLPLCLYSDVSRINATPGNLMIQQIIQPPPTYIRPEGFLQPLVASMFNDEDSIAHHLRLALGSMPEAASVDMHPVQTTPRTAEEFIEAVNGYDGPMLIVDSHGMHSEGDHVGALIIGGQPVDVWSFADRIRVPPIVILSACDTHPYDRTHATVANGFIKCGAVAVLATALPIMSTHAAQFLVRLLLRAITFSRIIIDRGQAVPWTHIVGGALRMQLASDVLRTLERQGHFPHEVGRQIQLEANQDLNPRMHPDWLGRLGRRCQEAGGFDQERWNAMFGDIVGGSDVIRYVHVGNPETILLGDDAILERAVAEVAE